MNQAHYAEIRLDAATVIARTSVCSPMALSTKPIPVQGLPLEGRELQAWRGLLRIHATLSKALDAQLDAEHGLPLTSYEVLLYLGESSARKMRMCDLADSVLLSRSGLTRLVDRLERDGYITRESCSSDARGAFAKLTEAGEAKLSAARKTHLQGVRTLFLEHFNEEEQLQLVGFWQRVLPGACSAAGGHTCA
jgi:DNA-binding MarR family transcriptional regulator